MALHVKVPASNSDPAMRIYVVTEVYPSLYKPYFDTQFAEFVRAGHDLRVYAFGPGPGHVAGLEGDLSHISNQIPIGYVPVGRGSVPRFAARIAGNVMRNPAMRVSALLHARRASPPRVKGSAAVARMLSFPADRPDLCLVHNLLAGIHLTFLRDLYPGVPVALYYHGGELPDMLSPPDAWSRQAFKSADVVFTNTERSKAHAISRGGDSDRIVVSPVGFDLDQFPDPAAREYRRGQRLNIVSVGRLSAEKGFRYAVEAAHQLHALGKHSFHYLFVGGGPMLSELTEQAASGGAREVVDFAGALDRSELLARLREADVLVLPSITVGTWEENQACVVQEAMLSGTLVVATQTGGVPESLAPELHRFLVPEGDATAIARRIEEISELPTPELVRLGQAGRRFAESRYDIRRLNAQLLDSAMERRLEPVAP